MAAYHPDRWPLRSCRTEESAPILIVRHPTYCRHNMDVILEWAAANAPDVLSDFTDFDLGAEVPRRSDYRLCVFWLADPIQQWCPQSYRQAMCLEQWCCEHRIPMFNRPSRLVNAGKAAAAGLIRRVGLRTPMMMRLEDADDVHRAAELIGFPLIIREDWGHGEMMVRLNTPNELRRFNRRQFRRPVAVECIDVSDERGMYRKYRFQATGTLGTPQHLQTSFDWITRGAGRIATQATREEEIDYLRQPDPNAAMLLQACRALQLEFVAFDYGYDRSGQPVVWEANPFPHIHISRGRSPLTYRNFAMHSSIRCVLQSYYQQAGLEIPASLRPGRRERLPKAKHVWKRPYYRVREFLGSMRRRSTPTSRLPLQEGRAKLTPAQPVKLASSPRESK